MTADNFERSLDLVLAHEGGFCNHPRDRGGMTNLGITARVWASFSGWPATEQVMRGLTIDNVRPVYLLQYWRPAHCADLQSGLDYCVFDCAVNSGPSRAVKLLQTALGVVADGLIGPQTLAAIQAVPAEGLIRDMCAERLNFLQALPTFADFGRGWSRRVAEVEDAAVAMSQD